MMIDPTARRSRAVDSVASGRWRGWEATMDYSGDFRSGGDDFFLLGMELARVSRLFMFEFLFFSLFLLDGWYNMRPRAKFLFSHAVVLPI